MPMHYYLFDLGREDDRRRTIVRAYTAQDALTVVEATLCPTGRILAHRDGSFEPVVREVYEILCAPDELIEGLIDWKQRELRIRGFVDVDPEESRKTIWKYDPVNPRTDKEETD